MRDDIADPPWMGDDGLSHRVAYCELFDNQHDDDEDCY